ncbi:MAG: efflux RND transporter periplasmic adaptor subunit, partial [Pseudomonadota bacterium]
VCPMHPQIARGEPGSCPICGMDLVAVEQEGAEETGERKILYYRHPHNPTIVSDTPMKDEMGMDYVAVYDDGGGAAVKIAPHVVQNMGVRTATAERGRLWRRIDTVGYVGFDETLMSHVHPRTEGWIEKLAVSSEGERVEKGQLLFELYSPALVNAQEEYVQALGTGNRRLIRASRDRLVALGISKRQVATLEKTRRVRQRVRFHAGQAGIISSLKVREGMYVKPATEVMSLADLSSVWLLAEVFESQADWVQVGQPADVRLSFVPGKEWQGRVEYIYPSLNPKTRTLKVRLRFDNPDEDLKPNMYANVTIYGGPKEDVVIVPREALIRTGQAQRVILALGEGRFQPRTVVAGTESGEWVEIAAGLEEGERVVTSGQFLIDSEASFKASLARMSAPGQEAPSMSPAAAPVSGTGVLKKLMPGAGKVNMQHDPIEALGWPDMTMDFDLGEGVSLEGLNPGDAVEFELKETKDGYVIDAMRRRDAAGQ